MLRAARARRMAKGMEDSNEPMVRRMHRLEDQLGFVDSVASNKRALGHYYSFRSVPKTLARTGAFRGANERPRELGFGVS
jgi:hypothetical protein